MNSILANVI